MTCVLPTFQKDWTFSTLANDLVGTDRGNQLNSVLKVHAQRKLSGLTIRGSGNGVSGALDGVDRWTAPGDFPSFSAGVWCVYRFPNGAELEQTVHNFGQNNYGFVYSPGGLFTGGSSSARPTAIDEVILYNNSWYGRGEAGSDPQFYVHTWLATDGSCYRESYWCNGLPFGQLFFDDVDSPTSGWALPHYGLADKHFANVNSTNVVAYWPNWVHSPFSGTGMFKGWGPHGIMEMLGTVESSGYGSNYGLPHTTQTVKNSISNTYRNFPRCGLVEPVTNPDRGWHGRVFDMWWVAESNDTGSTFTTGSRTALDADGVRRCVIIGDMMLPWHDGPFLTGGSSLPDVDDFEAAPDNSECNCPEPPAVPERPSAAPVSGPTLRADAASDPLGAGIVRPFRRTEHQDFALASGPKLVMSCLGQLLGTPLGSLPWEPRFGSNLYRLRHRNQDPTFLDLARIYSDEAIRKWEPRASVSRVEIEPSAVPVGRRNVVDLIVYTKIGGQTLPVRVQV